MTDRALVTELRTLAENLARQAGDRAVELREQITLDIATKSSTVDLVTEADRQAEQLIVDGILNVRREDAIVGEEGTSRDGTSGVRWVIDPIDGTTNFVYRIPAFGVSIAAEVGDRIVAGAVYDPSRRRLYSAGLGQGASVDRSPISCSSPLGLATSLVATGFGYGAPQRQAQAEVLVTLLPLVRDIRRFGSAALDLCAVAEGAVDAYYERGLNHWDLAAGVLIAAEAGAKVGDLRGGVPSPTFTMAAAPAIFEPLRSILTDAGADTGA